MKKILFPIFILMFVLIVVAQTNVSYILTLNYDGKSLEKESLILVEGETTKDVYQLEEGFTLKVLGKNGEILYSKIFSVDLTPIYEAPDYFFNDAGEQVIFEDKESVQNIKETSIVLTFPYFEEAEKIQIYDSSNQLVLEFLIDEEVNKTKFNLANLRIVPILIVLLVGFLLFFIIKKIREKSKDKKKKGHEKKEPDHQGRIEALKKTIKDIERDLSSLGGK